MIDSDYYEQRLDDLSLLERSVPVFSLTAVPVGGKRRSGCVSFGNSDTAAAAAMLLHGDGFPNVRVEWSDRADTANVIEWGDELPDLPAFDATEDDWEQYDLTCGRLYGYREDVIAAFVIRDR